MLFRSADTGVTIRPTPKQKGDILKYTLEVARGLGLAVPHVALMAATEKFNPAMPETVDMVDLCRQAAAGDFGPALVQGPLSFDVAYAPDAGTKKRIDGQVVGAAEALVFPDLLSANLTVKAIMYTARCQFGGVLAGAGCPVVFMSRSDTVETRLNSLAHALITIPPLVSRIRPGVICEARRTEGVVDQFGFSIEVVLGFEPVPQIGRAHV
mgnify:CR=1 FL=1